MKVVCKETAIDKINKQLAEAYRMRKEVEYILLSRDEFEQAKALYAFDTPTYGYKDEVLGDFGTAFRAIIELNDPEHYKHPKVRFISYASYRGIPVYEVPERFMK
jgi:hypothetical protein